MQATNELQTYEFTEILSDLATSTQVSNRFVTSIKFKTDTYNNCLIIVHLQCYKQNKELNQNKKNRTNMHKLIYLVAALTVFTTLIAQKNKIVHSEGLFFTDGSQTKLYTGEYKEYFDNGSIKLEINIKDGKPQGAYIVYFMNGKPNEVRSYRNGEFHGLWRTYNEAGQLIAEAEYRNNKKHGKWFVWDDTGIMRYEMHYDNGVKTGTWFMWDEKGKLISEKKF